MGPKIQGSAIAALRLIRPMTEEEVKDIILISPDQRVRFLQIARNPNSKPYVTHFNSYFDLKEIYKTKNTIIGEYKATVLKHVKFLDNTKTFYAVFYAIKPKEKVYHNQFRSAELPEGYTLADSLVYVDPFFASNKITRIK